MHGVALDVQNLSSTVHLEPPKGRSTFQHESATNMAAKQVQLYMSPGTCAIVPQILLHHAGISYQPIGIPMKGLGSNFSATNPKGQVPVLVLDDELITENPAIAHAINHLAPNANILGRSPMEFVKVCEWMNFLSANLHAQTWGPYARPFRFTDEPSAEAGVKRKSLEKLRERFGLVESKIPEQGWVVGDGFTAVDAYLLPFSQWAEKRTDIDMVKEYPKWANLVRRVMDVDAVKSALAEEARIGTELGS